MQGLAGGYFVIPYTIGDYLGNAALGKVSTDHEAFKESIEKVPKIREAFWQSVRVGGEPGNLNENLELAGRVADYLEFAELLARDALHREESCGGHFREEHQTPEGEAERDDERFAHVAAWEWTGEGREPVLHKEELAFEAAKPSRRSYK